MTLKLTLVNLWLCFPETSVKVKFNKTKFMRRTPFNSEDKKLERGKSTIIKLDKAKVKCFNFSELGHFASECKKPRYKGKGKALMTTQKDWADLSSSEDELDYENIALMANSADKAESPKSSSGSSPQVSIFSVESINNLDSDGIKFIQVEIYKFAC